MTGKRPDIAAAGRVVVKVGSSSLTSADGAIDDRRIAELVAVLVGRVRAGGQAVLVSSGAGLVGARNMVGYAATKAFDMVMAESLWAELHDQGVDVLALVLGVTDTPALRRILARRGNLPSPDDATPIPGAATPDEVVADAIAHLSNGPTWFVGEQLRDGARHLGALTRSDAVKMLIEYGAGVMDTQHGAEAAP